MNTDEFLADGDDFIDDCDLDDDADGVYDDGALDDGLECPEDIDSPLLCRVVNRYSPCNARRHSLPNCDDNCPKIPNPDQDDRNEDGTGDVCDPICGRDPVPAICDDPTGSSFLLPPATFGFGVRPAFDCIADGPGCFGWLVFGCATASALGCAGGFDEGHFFGVGGASYGAFAASDYGSTKLGGALVTIPDLDGDGRDELVLGMPLEPALRDGASFPEAGQVVAVASRGGSVLWRVAGSSAGARLGTSLARSGAVIFAGAPGASNATGAHTGAVVRISLLTPGRVDGAFYGDAGGELFGTSVAIISGALASQPTQLLVGAPLASAPGRPEAGRLYLSDLHGVRRVVFDGPVSHGRMGSNAATLLPNAFKQLAGRHGRRRQRSVVAGRAHACARGAAARSRGGAGGDRRGRSGGAPCRASRPRGARGAGEDEGRRVRGVAHLDARRARVRRAYVRGRGAPLDRGGRGARSEPRHDAERRDRRARAGGAPRAGVGVRGPPPSPRRNELGAGRGRRSDGVRLRRVSRSEASGSVHFMRALLAISFTLLFACGGAPAGRSCSDSSDCELAEQCVDARCVPRPSMDASVRDGSATPDAGTDAGACITPCGAACCGAGERCTGEALCAADLGPCMEDGECLDDSYCHEGRCTPYGTPPRGEANAACRRTIQPGRFAPSIQCRWETPSDGDAAPTFRQVESTPLVVDFGIGRGPDEPIRPSIVFISAASFVYGDGGVLRVIDGRTCADQGVLAAPEDRVGGATTPAVGDLDGDGVPEIVAKSGEGGLVAFEWNGSSFARRWFSHFADGTRDRTGGAAAIGSLSIHDLDDDGLPEILMGGVTYGPDGTLLDGALGLHPIVGYSQPGIVADLDHDGDAELATGDGVFDWDLPSRAWVRRPWATTPADGFVAVADFGDFPGAAGDFPGGPEIAVISAGTARIQTIGGEVVFGPVALPGGSHGGNPTVGDFDGDGRAELACGGPGSLTVFDLDCVDGGGTGRCASARTDGILWTQVVRDFSSGINGSSVFDFEGDGRAEVVYADECFLRVFDGETGAVVWSAPRSSGTWIEAPVIADPDGDFNAEIVVGSNSAHGACPGIDPLHAGLTCTDESDCAAGSACSEGHCRCTTDEQCGDPTSYGCVAPLTGGANVCRARFTDSIVGIRVYADASDRWVSSRRVWNQHAYAVTGVREDGTIPRTSEVARNWSEPGLNDFRRNVQGDLIPLAGPDLTIGRGSFDRGCTPAMPVISLNAVVCNRGAEPVDSGMIATFYDGDPRAGGVPICSAVTARTLRPGTCEPVSCDWDPAPTEGSREVWLWVDAADDNVECVETNNIARIAAVGCILM